MKKLILLLLIFSNAAMAQRAVEYANDTNRAPRPGRYGLVVVDGHFYSIDSDKNLSLILQDSVIQSRVIGLVDSLVAIKATALGEETRAKAAETALSNRITADSTRLNAEALNIDNAQAALLNHESRIDAMELIDHDHANKTILDGTEESFTTILKNKLDGVSTAATANSSDATLLSRVNHTGTQTASTISDFNAAADARVVAGITGKFNTPSGLTTDYIQYWNGTGFTNSTIQRNSSGVGVDMSATDSKLQVNGQAKVGDQSYPIRFNSVSSTAIIEGNSEGFNLVSKGTGYFYIKNNNITSLTIDNAGKVAVGNGIPANLFDVKGTAQATKMLVNTSTDVGYQLDVNGAARVTSIRLAALQTAPVTSSAACTSGEIRLTVDGIYYCTSSNSWKRKLWDTF